MSAASRIVGPTYIDGMTQVKQFTIIEASYIGYNCRVGGEIEHSVISLITQTRATLDSLAILISENGST